ncbi:MAG: hypothetical protein NTV77_00670 [Candidatus Azambacteria bacterium]|nr:hypothetical protein [Candidatus Azambacteria bacterium]
MSVYSVKMSACSVYKAGVWKKLLAKNNGEFRELRKRGFEHLGNFYRGELMNIPQVDEERKILEEAGYEVEIANAYNIYGEYMPESNSVWRKKKERRLEGQVITDRERLAALKQLRAQLRKKLSNPERAKIIRQLNGAFGIRGIKRINTFQKALDCIDDHLNASTYFLRIKEKEFKEGMCVSFAEGERIGNIESIMWDGHLKLFFRDGKKPEKKLVSPFLVEAVI